MTHKNIKRFSIDVIFNNDSDMIRIRAQYESLLVQKMRHQGYVLVLDINPAFSVEFDGQTWKFKLTLHGIYVGKKKAWQYEGWTQGKLIPRATHQTTLRLL